MEDEPMTQEDFARILRSERKRAGLTQDEMAAALKMHQSQYSRLERGEGRYTVLHLIRAKRRLGVDYDVLTGERKVGGRTCRTQG
jgi:transcriptional regulator with XRE-family HTH domain